MRTKTMMKSKMKRVTSLGLGLVMTGGLLAACDAPESDAPESDGESSEIFAEAPAAPAPAAASGEAGEGGEGEGGEGGEGEGGVATADASTDPVVFNAALAITAAHVFAARDAHAAGETDAAAEMFAHPVSEVLLDMGSVFAERGVEPFSQLLMDASDAVFAGESAEQITARSDAILAAIAEAADKAPDDGSTQAEIAAGVAVDQIDRASDMYRIAQDTGQYGPYLDGYGFMKAGELAFAHQAEAIEAAHPEVAARIRVALEVLNRAYPSAQMPETLEVDRAELAAASTQAALAVINR
jgi:hypothetical protein